jgi:hypothetical protein
MTAPESGPAPLVRFADALAAAEARQSSASSYPGIKRCPPEGQGVHHWCYYAYNTMREQGASHEEAKAYCEHHATRPLKSGDVPNSIAAKDIRLRGPQLDYRPEVLERLGSKLSHFGVEEMKRLSPLDPDTETPATVLRHLYRPGEKVLLFNEFASQGHMVWECPPTQAHCDEKLFAYHVRPAFGRGAWFVANPVTGDWIELPRLVSENNPRGRTRRSVENLTAYRYCVVESDKAPPDLWLRLLAQLPLPIAAITTSGGKSIHALFVANAVDLEGWRQVADEIARIVVPLGADPATLRTPAQLTRAPGFFRAEKGRWQELLYLNPNPTSKPICSMNERTNK